MDILGTHGFYPQEEYFYFETPYSSDEARNHYSYELASEEAAYDKRMFEICHQGTGASTNKMATPTVLWFLIPVTLLSP